jgi:hypothetical protein
MPIEIAPANTSVDIMIFVLFIGCSLFVIRRLRLDKKTANGNWRSGS